MTAPAARRNGVDPLATAEPLLDGLLSSPRTSPQAELGVTGLKRQSGLILEEFHPKLTYDKALKVYEEMTANSPVVGAMLFAIDALARQVKWYVEPSDENDTTAVEQAEFVEECLHDMSYSWVDHLSDILSMLAYGWSYHEIVYKRRQGAQTPGSTTPTSQYDDGKIGWRKIPIRAQNTRHKWLFDPQGGIQGMVQLSPPEYRLVTIPIEKALLFRPKLNKNNPEGWSLLRTAYRPWYFAKRLEEIEAIGIERDLAGLPVIEAPAELFDSAAGSAQQTTLSELKKTIVNIRRGEQEGVLLPQSYDDKGNPTYKLSLLSTGGERQIDMSKVLERYDLRILQTVMADFLQLGHEKVGSFALSSDKTNLFSVAMGSVLDSVAEVMNRHAIPRLMDLNAMDPEQMPRLCHGDIETPDPAVVGEFVAKLTAAGMPIFPDLKAENILRGYIGLPDISQEEFEEREAALQEQKDAELEAMRSGTNATDVGAEATMMEAEATMMGAEAKMREAKKPMPAAKRDEPSPSDVLIAALTKRTLEPSQPSVQLMMPALEKAVVTIPDADVDAVAKRAAQAVTDTVVPQVTQLAAVVADLQAQVVKMQRPKRYTIKRDKYNRMTEVEEQR